MVFFSFLVLHVILMSAVKATSWWSFLLEAREVKTVSLCLAHQRGHHQVKSRQRFMYLLTEVRAEVDLARLAAVLVLDVSLTRRRWS